MNEPLVQLVKSQGFTINSTGIGAPVAVGAESDEVVILMRLTLRPRDNVVNVDFDVSTDGASVSSFDKNPTADVSRYWRTSLHGDISPSFDEINPRAAENSNSEREPASS